MTSTTKVSIIDDPQSTPDTTNTTNSGFKSQVEDSSSAQQSGYISVGNDPWKALIDTPSDDLGSMLDSMNGVGQPPAYKGPKDAYLSYLSEGDASDEQLSAMHEPRPYVPKYDELSGDQRTADNAVQLYDSLINEIAELKKNAMYYLKEPMNDQEVRSTQLYLKELDKRELKATINRQQAKYWEFVQKTEEDAQKEAAEAKWQEEINKR